MIHNPMRRPRSGLVETTDWKGERVYIPAADKISSLAQSGAEMTEALEMILSGETGEEGDDES